MFEARCYHLDLAAAGSNPGRHLNLLTSKLRNSDSIVFGSNFLDFMNVTQLGVVQVEVTADVSRTDVVRSGF